MDILGISCFYHDAAAALLRDGDLAAAAHEERFTRKKHDPGLPKNAVQYCLSEAGIGVNDLDYLVFYDKPFIKFERMLLTYLATFPRSLPSFSKAMPIWIMPSQAPASWGWSEGHTRALRSSQKPKSEIAHTVPRI